jgi:pyruvate,water dikinase
MVRSDKACSGVGFTLDPGSGFRGVVHIAAAWGLGENVVQGTVNPDEFLVFKKTFELGKESIISRKLGGKEWTLGYASRKANGAKPVVNRKTSPARRARFCLGDSEIYSLAHACLAIEKHFGTPMDVEWAKDGLTQELFVVQARPETAHVKRQGAATMQYRLEEKGRVLAAGMAVGSRIAAGPACVLRTPAEAARLKPGDVLVTDSTNPDWDPVMKRTAAVVTNKGGRTSHAAIVARELGVAAVVGAGNATASVRNGQQVTVCCAEGQEGKVYEGRLRWSEEALDPLRLPLPRTHAMLILADPGLAFGHSCLPCHGVGLMRLEFAIAGMVQAHPMALAHYDSLRDREEKRKIARLTKGYPDKKEYFVDKLSQAVAVVAAAFYPREVIVRMSDFKSNEYANLAGGRAFEPAEENPMIGFRGASRYDHDRYRDGFRLECLAMKRVREVMGLTNVKLMIPFCRTVEEGRRVVARMASYGLKRGADGLEIYLMVEIPSNVLLLGEFAEVFDGFSIGSNDLTQLTLGIDRDSALISGLFDERNAASRQLIARAVEAARRAGKPIGLCGQAPSDWPEFAEFLVSLGIGSISFNADALLRGIENMNRAEGKQPAGRESIMQGPVT